jgi:hypothetical protein
VTASWQRCIEPGHWVIGGRHVRAVYLGRSRHILSWNVQQLYDDPVPPPAGFLYLDDARDWIRAMDSEKSA